MAEARPTFLRNLVARLDQRGRPPRLSCGMLPSAPRGWRTEVRVQPSETGTGVEFETGSPEGGWRPLCGATYSDRAWRLVPRAATPVELNGLPVTGPTAVTSGDVLTAQGRSLALDGLLCGVAVRLVVEGEPLRATTFTQSEWFVRELRAGLLDVDEGPDFRRAVLRSHDLHEDALLDGESRLAAFSSTPLARSLTALELVVCRRPHRAGVEVATVLALARALGELLPRTTFVVPAPLSLPDGLRARVASPVQVRFDGTPVALSAPVFLTGTEEGLRLAPTYSPGPFLCSVGQAAFLSCEEGWGALESVRRAGVEVAIAGGRQFQVPLLAGDEWELRSRGAVHRLTVQPSPGAPADSPRQPRAGRASPFVFEGEELRRVTFHLAEGDIGFAQDGTGLFHGPWPRPFCVAGPGQLKWFRGDAGFTLYDVVLDEQGRPALVLPSPSGFLRGRTLLPAGPLNRESLAVFLDLLLEHHDGAALALRRLLEAGPEERPRWFTSLLLDRECRRSLQPWLELERESLARFGPVLRVTRAAHATALLRAVAVEPLFQYVREVQVDLPAAEWTPSLWSAPRPAKVRVVWRRDGRLVGGERA